MYFVYILVSTRYRKTYIGITDNINRRLKQHNKGYHFYTKRFLPWKLKYFEQLNNRLDARKREKYFKSVAGRRWMAKKVFGKDII